MIKEFEINDILNAVDSISKMERKSEKNLEVKKNSLEKLKSRGHNPALIFIGEACIKKNTLHYYLLRGSATLRK